MRQVLIMRICTYCLLFALAACAPKPEIVVEERTTISERQETEKLGGRLIRIVQPGDTLYSIAFANDLDVNELAQWNNIQNIRRIAVGQRIRLTKPIGFVAKKKQAPVVQVEVETKARTTKPTSNNNKPRVANQAPSSTSKKPASTNSSNSAWNWPIRGKIVESFVVSKGQQGISIEGNIGSPVFATKAGEVVYVGNALKGYGNLIIIKHSERFLSAYAHNLKTFVVEGQMIEAKQRIGSVGTDNKRRKALHFQIRKDGKPVNPLSYLPRG